MPFPWLPARPTAASTVAAPHLAALLVAAGLAGAGARPALATNFIVNGTFAQSSATAGGGGFYGWTVASAPGAQAPGKGPQIIATNGVTRGPFGDVIAPDTATSPDPDTGKAGGYAAYFVDDTATQTLTQRFWLPAGTYEVGFDLYATSSGYNNLNNALFSASIAGTTITSANVSSYPKATWEHFGANATVQSAGWYAASFTFTSGAVPAKDIVIDDVYVINPPSLPGGGTVVTASVPEPGAIAATWALFALGAPLIAARRRRPTTRDRRGYAATSAVVET